ncbi:MAG: hypothetical protein RLY93_18715 [Sumerlaeia bacterium]
MMLALRIAVGILCFGANVMVLKFIPRFISLFPPQSDGEIQTVVILGCLIVFRGVLGSIGGILMLFEKRIGTWFALLAFLTMLVDVGMTLFQAIRNDALGSALAVQGGMAAIAVLGFVGTMFLLMNDRDV